MSKPANHCPTVAARAQRAKAIREYYRAGHTHDFIARQLNLERTTVTYYLSPRCKALA